LHHLTRSADAACRFPVPNREQYVGVFRNISSDPRILLFACRFVGAPSGTARSQRREEDLVRLSEHALEFFDALWEVLEVAFGLVERQRNRDDQPCVQQIDVNARHDPIRTLRQRRYDDEFACGIFLAQPNTLGSNTTRDPAGGSTEISMTGDGHHNGTAAL